VRQVWIEIDNASGLVIGLRVDVLIKALPCPESADSTASTRRPPRLGGQFASVGNSNR
jgi:hypothetical protein